MTTLYGLCKKTFGEWQKSNLKTRKCIKCKKTFQIPHSNFSSIWTLLCTDCAKEWLKFFPANYERLENQYSDRDNPTWDIFIGNFLKEKVEFT